MTTLLNQRKKVMSIQNRLVNACRKCSSYHSSPSTIYSFRNPEYEKSLQIKIKPFIDISYIENKAKNDLIKRGKDYDVNQLISKTEKFSKCIKEEEQLSEKYNSLVKRKFSKNMPFSNDSLKLLSNLEEKLQSVKNELIVLEDSFVVPALKLPAELNNNVPSENCELLSMFDPPTFNFKPKCHVELGTNKHELQFNQNVYYLMENLALAEHSLVNIFVDHAIENGAQLVQSTADFSRMSVVEGCNNLHKRLHIFDKYCHLLSKEIFLTGGASLESFINIFIKNNIQAKFRVVSSGIIYNKNINNLEQQSLFNTTQSHCVSMLNIYPASEQKDVEDTCLQLIAKIYSKLGIHFKVVSYSAPHLHENEAMAYGIMMFSPFRNDYVEVGRLSFLGDFISKRLEIKRKREYQHIAYLKLFDSPKFIACMIENMQDENGAYECCRAIFDIL